MRFHSETCIKGHRSSTCNHTERPLFEIKKKGRPITQCEHCRELRKTKQVHVKCVCEGKDDLDAISHSIPAKKGKSHPPHFRYLRSQLTFSSRVLVSVANRKGPPPSAAFPFGLQSISAPASDSEDASPFHHHHGLTRPKASSQTSSRAIPSPLPTEWDLLTSL